jgi:hypothetical protein
MALGALKQVGLWRPFGRGQSGGTGDLVCGGGDRGFVNRCGGRHLRQGWCRSGCEVPDFKADEGDAVDEGDGVVAAPVTGRISG